MCQIRIETDNSLIQFDSTIEEVSRTIEYIIYKRTKKEVGVKEAAYFLEKNCIAILKTEGATNKEKIINHLKKGNTKINNMPEYKYNLIQNTSLRTVLNDLKRNKKIIQIKEGHYKINEEKTKWQKNK